MDRNDKITLIFLAILMLTIVVIALISTISPQGVHTPSYSNIEQVLEDPENVTGREPGTQNFDFYRDTAAQWTMALFAGIGAVISAVAVKLVNETLRTSRDASTAAIEAVTAANAANDLMRQDQRPWINLSVASVGPIDLRFNDVSARVMVENIGPSPALDVGVSIRAVIVRTTRPDKIFVTRFIGRAIDDAGNAALASGVIFPSQSISTNVSADHIGEIELERQFEKGPVRVALTFVCTYRSSRTDKYFHTSLTVLAWEQLGNSTKPFDMDGGYGIERITFQIDERLTSVS